MCLLKSSKKANSHVRKYHIISTFLLLNYCHLSFSPHFSKSWDRYLSFCLVSYPCLSHCTEIFQHDLYFGQRGLLIINYLLQTTCDGLIHPLIILIIQLFSALQIALYHCFNAKLLYPTHISFVFSVSQTDSFFKLFWDGNCLPFIFTLWVFPRNILSLPHSFSFHPWQPAFLSSFMVCVMICQMTNHCIPLSVLSPYISLILALSFFSLYFSMD